MKPKDLDLRSKKISFTVLFDPQLRVLSTPAKSSTLKWLLDVKRLSLPTSLAESI